MKAFFDIGREDIRPLISRIGSRFGFGVGVPVGYLAFSQEQKTTPCSANTASKSATKSPIATFPGRGLKHELFVQQNEEALANIIHGTPATSPNTSIRNCALLENSVCRQSSLDDQRCRSPDSKLLTWENSQDAKLNYSTDKNLQNSQSNNEKESSEIEDPPWRQNTLRNRLLEYHDLQDEKQTAAEMERTFIKIDMIDENLLPLKIPYWADEEQRKYELREMLEHSEIMFMNLKRSMKLDLPQIRTMVPALEYKITVQDDHNQKKDENNAEDQYKMKNSELPKDDSNNHSKSSLRIKQDSDVEQMADCTPIIENSSSYSKVQEVEKVDESSQIGAQDDKLTQHRSDLSSNSASGSEIISNQVHGEKVVEGDRKMPSPDKKGRAKKLKIVKALLNTVKGRTSRKIFDSDNDSSFHSSASFSATSTSNNNSSSDAKANKSSQSKLISNIIKHLPGKHVHHKKSASSNTTPSTYNSSENNVSVSKQHSDNSYDSRSCLSICSEVSMGTTSTDQLSRKVSMDNCWQSDGAWCHNAYRSPIGTSGTYRRRKLGDYLKIKNC